MNKPDKLKEFAKLYNRSIEEFQYRLDGRIEFVCSCGVGHTVYSPYEDGNGVHGCCSNMCCIKLRKGTLDK